MSSAEALETLAAWAAGLSADEVPAEQRQLARLRLLDTIGLIAAAAGHPVRPPLVAWAAGQGVSGPVRLFVADATVSPATAALVHGSLAHARDFDDTFVDTVIHPGSTIIATALAVGEAEGAGFDDLVAAVAAGYEVAARLGAVAGRAFHARGFHATGVVGPMAAAVVAGRLRRLEGPALCDAIGLAASMSSGLLAFLADGGWSKWLHCGWAAHGGIVAADLAGAGFRGARHVLDHAYGVYAAFAGLAEPELAPVTDGLGRHWSGGEAHFKLYPCAHVIQPFLDAVLAMRAQDGVAAADIAEVRCRIAPWACPIVCEPRERKVAPRNDLDAIASLPFLLAAALVEGAVDLDTLEPANLARRELRALAERIVCVPDAALGRGFDGEITIAGHDGTVTGRAVAAARPDAERVVAKFRANARRRYSAEQVRTIERALMTAAPTAPELARLCAGGVRDEAAPRPAVSS